MGITRFWDLVGAPETRSIAAWSSEHYRTTGRPLRIAVDEAYWRWNAISAAQEFIVKSGSKGSHPREKDILERTLFLLQHNVQLVFVFDGPKKLKKGQDVGLVREDKVRVLKSMLQYLGIPAHYAPADAKAECVRMQQLGTVDAVFSDDSDAFMSGCHTLVKFFLPKWVSQEKKGPKSKKEVNVYQTATMWKDTVLTQSETLLFALLVGNDYDNRQGLPGCGLETAKDLVRHPGLAENLACISVSSDQDLKPWRGKLASAVFQILGPDSPKGKTLRKHIVSFPSFTTFMACKSPKVSEDSKLDPAAFERRWFPSFQRDQEEMVELFEFFVARFYSRKPLNFPVEYFLPLELNNRLRETNATVKAENDGLPIELKPCKHPGLTTVRIGQPELVLHALSHVDGWQRSRDKGKGIEKLELVPVEFDLLTCVLEHGFSDTALEAKTTKLKTRAWKPTKESRINEKTSEKSSSRTASTQKRTAEEDTVQKKTTEPMASNRKRHASLMSSIAKKPYHKENSFDSAKSPTKVPQFKTYTPILSETDDYDLVNRNRLVFKTGSSCFPEDEDGGLPNLSQIFAKIDNVQCSLRSPPARSKQASGLTENDPIIL